MRGTRGQTIVEYAIVIAVVIAVLIGMRRVMLAHLCGGWRAAVDQFGHGHQYEREVTTDTYDEHDSVGATFF